MSVVSLIAAAAQQTAGGGVGPTPITGQRVALDGVNDYVETPDSAALDLTGDIDIRAAVALDDWATGTEQTLVAKWGFLTLTDQRAYLFRVLGGGALELRTSPDGSTQVAQQSTVAVGASDGSLLLIRATLDVDNGASGSDYEFFTKSSTAANAVADMQADTGWTQLGSTVTGGSTTSIASTTAPLLLGATDETRRLAAGDFYGAVVKDGINGTTVAVFDPNDAALEATSVTDSDTSLVWTVNGGASVGPVLDVVAASESADMSGASQVNITATKPTGTAENDLMIVSIMHREGAGGLTAPAGWTLVDESAVSTGFTQHLAIYSKTASASEPASWTWNGSVSGRKAYGAVTFRNLNGTTCSVDVSASNTPAANVTNHEAPSVTASDTGQRLVLHVSTCAFAGGTTTWSTDPSTSQFGNNATETDRLIGMTLNHVGSTTVAGLAISHADSGHNSVSTTVAIKADA